MSLSWKIQQKVNDLCIKNKIPTREISVTYKEVEEELRRKKVIVYVVKVVFNTNKPLLDYFIVIHNYFIVMFKPFRVHINFTERSLKFNLKERNLSVLDDVLEGE